MNRRNIRLVIAFDGTGYSGWQRQKNAKTIQGTVEQSLATITNAQVSLNGAGRTDAGVHALGMTANFLTESAIHCDALLRGLNSMLPPDIRILQTEEVTPDFHSRFNATGKTYRYDIFTGKVQLPTERNYTAHFPWNLNIAAINTCLHQILGPHDFTSFEGSGSRDTELESGRGAVRTVVQAEFTPHQYKRDTWSFYFTGDGFLRHMVRNLVGTLIEAGKNKITPDDFHTILQARDRSMAGPTAPANGLFLVRVLYET